MASSKAKAEKPEPKPEAPPEPEAPKPVRNLTRERLEAAVGKAKAVAMVKD